MHILKNGINMQKNKKKQLWSYCIPILDYFGLAASCCLVSLHSTQTYMYQLTKKK